MRKIYLLMTVCVLALLASCADEASLPTDKGTDSGTTPRKRSYVFAYQMDDESTTDTKAGSVKLKQWKTGQTIRIKFLNGNSTVQERVKEVAAQWLEYANLQFEYVAANQTADVKISFNDGEATWSKIGTDAKRVAQAKPSMNLTLYDEYDWNEIYSEDFQAVILRGFGHMLGLIFEHQNATSEMQWDEARVIRYFRSQGWTDNDIDYVLDTYRASQTNYTAFDEESIMLLYFPDFLMLDGKGTRWNIELSDTDKQFINAIYPGKAMMSLPSTLKLTYSQDGSRSQYAYKGVRIGEYYWVNNNFYHRVPRNPSNLEGWENEYPMSQARLNKYLPCAKLDVNQYQINIDDFNRYYGIYYNRQSVDYMSRNGKIHEEGKSTAANWELPAAADYQQLFAMCPFSGMSNNGDLTSLGVHDVMFALGAKMGHNPLAFDIHDLNAGGPYKTYWFSFGKGTYDFNMMPGGAVLNGSTNWNNGLNDPHPGVTGDIYHLFYTAGFHTKESNIYIHDDLDTRNPESYHWYNVRWCRKLTDIELGYKLCINAAKTDIKKIGAIANIPNGYSELPHGYLRGFYVQYILDNPTPKYTVANIVEFANKIQDTTPYK